MTVLQLGQITKIYHNLIMCHGFLFRSEYIFRTTRELAYVFFLSRKARKKIPDFNIRLYDKYSESD
jgi:hypothetical protein